MKVKAIAAQGMDDVVIISKVTSMRVAKMNGWSLLAAPHRMFFTTGLAYLVAASAWWLGMLISRAWFGAGLEPVIPGVFAHGALMLYLVFTPFMFGFLVTVFPRWQEAPPLPNSLCLAAFVLMILALPVMLLGMYVSKTVLVAGWLAYCAGYLLVFGGLLGSWLVTRQTVSHSIGTLAGLFLGLAGAFLFAWMLVGSNFALWPYVRSVGLWGFLLTVFFAVSHRMVPFFTSCVIRNYPVWRPDWMLHGFVALAIARAALELHPTLRWVPVLGMAVIALSFSLRWRPRENHRNPLLSVLHISMAWLVVALFLQLAQDLGLVLFDKFWLGRAPLHAMAFGYFGSMLVSMITRVTMGHSGRPLEMNKAGWRIFLLVQLAAVARVGAELLPFTGTWLTVFAAGAWFVAFAAWAIKYGAIYFQPRADGRPG